MRRLNAKLFLILLASVTVGGVLVHGLHAYQVYRHSGMFLREAERAGDAGQAVAEWLTGRNVVVGTRKSCPCGQ